MEQLCEVLEKWSKKHPDQTDGMLDSNTLVKNSLFGYSSIANKLFKVIIVALIGC